VISEIGAERAYIGDRIFPIRYLKCFDLTVKRLTTKPAKKSPATARTFSVFARKE